MYSEGPGVRVSGVWILSRRENVNPRPTARHGPPPACRACVGAISRSPVHDFVRRLRCGDARQHAAWAGAIAAVESHREPMAPLTATPHRAVAMLVNTG